MSTCGALRPSQLVNRRPETPVLFIPWSGPTSKRALTVEERLTNHLQNGCSAPVRANIGRHPYGSAQVYWVDVPRQRGFEPLRQDGRVWVRRERSTVEPSPMELQEL